MSDEHRRDDPKGEVAEAREGGAVQPPVRGGGVGGPQGCAPGDLEPPREGERHSDGYDGHGHEGPGVGSQFP